jgi:hypothetical protein
MHASKQCCLQVCTATAAEEDGVHAAVFQVDKGLSLP